MRALPFFVLFALCLLPAKKAQGQGVSGNMGLKPMHTKDILELLHAFERDTHTLHVVNFWATWCGPCVQELPLFRAADSFFRTQSLPVAFSFFSFDMKEHTKHASALMLKKGFTDPGYLIDEVDHDALIRGVSEQWQGNIPLTVILGKGAKVIHDQAFPNIEALIHSIQKP